MDCSKYRKMISAEVDGFLNNQELFELDNHCITCPSCREERKQAAEIYKICQTFQDLQLDSETKSHLVNTSNSKNSYKKICFAGTAAVIVTACLLTFAVKTSDMDIAHKLVYNPAKESETQAAADINKSADVTAGSQELTDKVSKPGASFDAYSTQSEHPVANSNDRKEDINKYQPEESFTEIQENVEENLPETELSEPAEKNDNNSESSESLPDDSVDENNTQNDIDTGIASGGGSSESINSSVTSDSTADDKPHQTESITIVAAEESKTLVYDAILNANPEAESVPDGNDFTIELTNEQFYSIIEYLNSAEVEFIITKNTEADTINTTFSFTTTSEENSSDTTEQESE